VYYRNTKFSAEGHLRRLLPQNTEVDNLAALQKLVVFEVMALVTWALTSGTLHLLTIRPKRVLQVSGSVGLWCSFIFRPKCSFCRTVYPILSSRHI